MLLAGLLLNATLGWSWADPIAVLVIAAVAVREGLEAWRGEGCACGPAPASENPLEATPVQNGVDDCCSDPAEHRSEQSATAEQKAAQVPRT